VQNRIFTKRKKFMKILKVLVRLYTENFEEKIDFYEKLFNEKVGIRFKLPDAGLELA
jgi:hypothetical protein